MRYKYQIKSAEQCGNNRLLSIPASRERAKKIARKFDHGAIYWHIAGSYSPLTIIAMRTAGEPVWAWVILGDVCHMIATWKVLQMFIIS